MKLQMEWREDKELSGWRRSPTTVSPLGSPLPLYTSKDSWNKRKAGFFTGNLSSISEENSLSEGCESCWAHGTMNLRDQRPLKTMFGKRLLACLEQSSNSELSPSRETERRTGMTYGPPPSPEILAEFPRTSEYVVTLHCEPSARSFYYQLALRDLVRSIGAEVELVSQERPGKEPVWRVILKTQEQSSGVGIQVKQMLLSMNLEEASIYPTCLGGWIDTRVELKSRDLLCPCVLGHSGSLVTLTQQLGGQTWTQRL